MKSKVIPKTYSAAFSFAAILTAHALFAAQEIPTLTPKDVLHWMAPLRLQDGRLGVDWSTAGIISSELAGATHNGAKTIAAINTDVKFRISVKSAAANQAPEFEVVLHVEGGSENVKNPLPGGNNLSEIPVDLRIAQKEQGGGLNGDLRARGALSADASAFDISDIKLNLDSATCLALYAMNRRTREFSLTFKEERVLKFDLSISESKHVLLIHFQNLDASGGFEFTQKPNGEAELSFDKGAAKAFLRAASLRELIQKHTPEIQLNLLRPLADIGVQVALNPDLPTVMAAATTAFSEPLPETVQVADAMIKEISSAATPQARARALTDLTRFFPQAIAHISKAAENEPDPQIKAALQKVVAAHPGIAQAKPYVLKNKLHEDRDYLFDLFFNAPFFKDAARARLATLLGKDYGDDPEAWKISR